MEEAREFQKSIYFCFIDYAKAFDCVDHNKLWEILKEMGIPDHLTCLLRNLYAGQEATVRTGHPLLGIHIEETRIERDTCTPMFIAALFTIGRTWKQPRCPLADEWIRKL